MPMIEKKKGQRKNHPSFCLKKLEKEQIKPKETIKN